jgi:hypothetical protein
MKTKVVFTPGPYEADFRPVRCGNDIAHWEIIAPTPASINSAHGSYNIADTLNRHHCISPEEDEANSRMLAAAWEMWRDLHYAKQLHICLRQQFAELQGRVGDAHFAQHELDIILEVIDQYEPNFPSIAKAEGTR